MININPQLRRAFQLATQEGKQIGRDNIDSVTLTLGILLEGRCRASQIMGEHGLNPQTLRAHARKYPVASQLFEFSLPEVKAKMPESLGVAVEKAGEIANHFSLEAVTPEAMLMALIATDDVYRDVLNRAGIDEKRLRAIDTALQKHLSGDDYEPLEGEKKEDGEPVGDTVAAPGKEEKEEKQGWFANLIGKETKAKPKSKTPTLDKYTRDLVALAKKKQLAPCVGRQKEITKVIQILGRKTKNNPVLVGEAGVGKTAIAEGIAQRIADGTVPKRMKNKKILALDLTAMVAGTKYRGEFEERMVLLIKEVKENKNVILFIDELHTLVGAGAGAGSLDASNALKPALARGEISTIGATTLGEYRKHIEIQDAALTRRFRMVLVDPPSTEETIQILHGLRPSYEEHHGVKISDEALKEAAEMSARYVSDRFQPDKSIDLMDEAASKLALETDNRSEKDPTPIVTGEHIAQVVSAMTGIPVTTLTADETERLLGMEEIIHRRLIGQRQAVSTVAKAIRRGRAGLKDPKRPLGTYLFLGPTGVGKTELARALQEFLSGKEDDMIRLDMSEYMEKHSVATMIGAPPGYVGYEDGGKLTEAVRRRPYAVVLLDEIEKAHPDVFNILLQIFEDGRLTDRMGRTTDFRNTIIIMTSNVGAHKLQRGSKNGELTQEVIDNVMQDVTATFNPEFINRLDDVICFSQLTEDEVGEIRELFVDKVRGRVKDRHLTIKLEDDAKAFLLKRGFDPIYGARPMRRAVQKHLEDPLAEAILASKPEPGTVLVARVKGGTLVVEPAPKAPKSDGTGDANQTISLTKPQ